MFRLRPWSRPAWRLSLGALLLVGSWLFIGVYEDREWPDTYIFLKHRPYVKMFFYSPLGEADPSSVPGHEGYLTPDQEREEKLYVEFVEVHHGYRRSLPVPLPNW
jgi:hypothetical protein